MTTNYSTTLTTNNDFSPPVVGGFVVHILIFPVRKSSKTVGLSGDVDTPIRVPGTEVDNIHRIIGDGLRAELC